MSLSAMITALYERMNANGGIFSDFKLAKGVVHTDNWASSYTINFVAEEKGTYMMTVYGHQFGDMSPSAKWTSDGTIIFQGYNIGGSNVCSIGIILVDLEIGQSISYTHAGYNGRQKFYTSVVYKVL